MSIVSELVARPCSWLASPGQHQGIVISSRIRLARNLASFHFQRKLRRSKQQELVDHLMVSLNQAAGLDHPHRLLTNELSDVERQALCERQLISRDLAGGKRPSGVYLSGDERHSLMLNEEDHVRLQVLGPGLKLDENLRLAVELDQRLETVLDWAVHPHYGYLSACPTNAGTGLRASVMVHLPALAETQDLHQVLRGLGKLHMTVRGLHGEGSEASGHYYQISNQRSLGHSEPDIVAQISEAVEKIIAYEQLARQALLERNKWRLEDRVFRAWGLLTYARSMSHDELIDQLSWVRLGVALGLVAVKHWENLDRIFVQCQPAHLQLQHADVEIPEHRDRLRADLVRKWLAAA